MNRVFHPWWKWECYKAGFYATSAEGRTSDECREMYRDFLSDIPRFMLAMQRVFREWPCSSEQFLTHSGINRIAWLGQASMCIETGVPSCFRGGFQLLTNDGRRAANEAARQALVLWTNARGTVDTDFGSLI